MRVAVLKRFYRINIVSCKSNKGIYFLDPDSSDNIMTAYSVLGAALVLLVIMATLTISYSLKQKRTERLV